MRTLTLIKNLTESELIEVQEIIDTRNRKTLSHLFTFLRQYKRRTSTPITEDLFKATFGKTYTQAQNYALRHELRLLNELLYEYIAVSAFKDQSRKNKSTFHQWLIRGIYYREIKEVFSAEIDDFIQDSRKDIKPDDTAAMLHYKSLWLIKHQKKGVDSVESQLKVLQELKEEELRHFKYRLREIKAREAYLRKTLIDLELPVPETPRKLEKTPPIEFIELPVNNEDWFEQYLILKKFAYQTRGEQRIEVLKQMLEIELSDDFKGEFSLNAPLATLTNIAMEHILCGEFTEAEPFFIQIAQRCKKSKIPMPVGALQNNIANQVNLGNYNNGIELFNEYNDIIISSRLVTGITLHKSYCHLFLNQPDEALQCLSTGIKFSPQELLQARMVYLIAFCLRNDFELALNEYNNLVKVIRNKKGRLYENYLFITSLFQKYIKSSANKNTALAEKMEKSIARELSSNAPQVADLQRTEFSLLWLTNTLNKDRI